MYSSAIVGRATTCWKAHLKGDESQEALIVKDSWQYPERPEEGEMLKEQADNPIVKNMTSWKVKVESLEDSSTSNSRTASSNSNSLKRKASDADELRQKIIKTEWSESNTVSNRIHRRVILRDVGKHLYHASTLLVLLQPFEQCVDGHNQLWQAGYLHRDISTNNLMLNEEGVVRGFLIDLDLAIRIDRQSSSGAKHITGTKPFMAINLLRGRRHTFMHDLESFYWICVHYDGPNKPSKHVDHFDDWNYMDIDVLAAIKHSIIIGDIFKNKIYDFFTSFYKPLFPLVDELGEVMFLDNEDLNLYVRMKEILHRAQKNLNITSDP